MDGRTNNLTPVQSKRALVWRFNVVGNNTTYLGLHENRPIFLSDFNHTLDFLESFPPPSKWLIIRFDGNVSGGSRAPLRLGRSSDGRGKCSRRF